MRSKREETENDRETTFDVGMDFFQAIKERNVTHGGVEVIKETTERFAETRARYDAYEYDDRRESTTTSESTPEYWFTEGRSVPADRTEKSLRLEDDEESYDYEKLKVEYEQQLEYSVRSGKTLNYTETKEEAAEDTPRKALKRIMDLKRPENCTREELSQIGIKALECLAHDYRRAKDVATVRRLLSRTWLVLRVWLLIYVCLAIPCWCQRGNLSREWRFSFYDEIDTPISSYER